MDWALSSRQEEERVKTLKSRQTRLMDWKASLIFSTLSHFGISFFNVKKTQITLSGLKRWAYLWDCEQPKPFLFSGTTPDNIVSQIYAIISEYPLWFLPFWARHSPNYLYRVGTISQTHWRSRTPHLHSDRLSPESWEFQRCKIPTYLSYRSQHSKEPKLYNS